MATRILPEQYRLAEKVSMLKNVKLLVGMNAVALVMLAAFVVGLLAGYAPAFSKGITFTITIIPLLITVLGIVGVLVLHELVHGIFIRFFTKTKVTYGFHGSVASAGSPDFFFRKGEYLIVALAPFLIINLALAAALPFMHGTAFVIAYCVLAFHFTGCVGDLYMVFKLCKYKPDTLIRDSGPEIELYVLDKRA